MSLKPAHSQRREVLKKLLKQGKKQLNQLESNKTRINQQLTKIKLKSIVFMVLLMACAYGFYNSLWEAEVVAVLPFTPHPIFAKFTHRGLHGQDLTECSWPFIGCLCSITIKAYIQKIMGFTIPSNSLKYALDQV